MPKPKDPQAARLNLGPSRQTSNLNSHHGIEYKQLVFGRFFLSLNLHFNLVPQHSGMGGFIDSLSWVGFYTSTFSLISPIWSDFDAIWPNYRPMWYLCCVDKTAQFDRVGRLDLTMGQTVVIPANWSINLVVDINKRWNSQTDVDLQLAQSLLFVLAALW